MLVWVAHEADTGYDEAAARSIDYAAMQTILTDWFSSGGAVAVISSQAARQALGAQRPEVSTPVRTSMARKSPTNPADVLVPSAPSRRARAPAARRCGSSPKPPTSAAANPSAGPSLTSPPFGQAPAQHLHRASSPVNS